MIDRTVYVGSTIPITATFLDDNDLPITPSDPTIYPNYVVKDINQDIVAFGVGTLDLVSNIYNASFVVPKSAIVSTPDSKWTVEWEMLSESDATYKHMEYFDVALPNFTESNYKEQQKVTLFNLPVVLSIPLESDVSNISFNLYDINDVVIFSGVPYQEGVYEGVYIYSVLIPANITTAGHEYSGIWTFTTTVQNSLFVKLYSANLYMMSLTSDLRLLVDKILKPLDLYLGYRDSDLIYSLHHGLSYLNLLVQYTDWDFNFIKSNPTFVTPLLMSAGWWLLSSQFLAQVDESFDYSGQAVSLTVDRTGGISEQMERWKSYLDEQFTMQKKHYLRGMQNFWLGVSTPTVSRRYGVSGINQLALQRAPWLIR